MKSKGRTTRRKIKETLTLKALLDICEKVEMGVPYTRLAQQMGVSAQVLRYHLIKSGLHIQKNRKRGEKPLENGWQRMVSAPKDRTILGWVEKPVKTINGLINQGYYCTVSWSDGQWDDGVEYHDICAWQELPEPPL